MSSNLRFLALAFASADLLLEVDDRLRIRFAMGAMPDPAAGGAERLLARDLLDVVAPGSRAALSDALAALQAGARGQSVDIVVRTDDGRARRAAFRAFMMPELAPTISCSIAYAGPVQAAAPETPLAVIASADAFASKAREVLTASHASGAPLSLAFVEVEGLHGAADRLGAEGVQMMREIEQLLARASWAGQAAARLEQDRYALLRPDGAPPQDLAGEVERIGEAHHVDLHAVVETAPVLPSLDPKASLRALRLTLDNFLRDGARGDGGTALSFSGAVMRTLNEAETFRTRVREGRFELWYQPVISLADGGVRHYEALTRFAADRSPAAIIRMAEEMSLMGEFDLAVARRALGVMAQSPGSALRLAVNVSGQSLACDGFIDALIERTESLPTIRPRLMIEVTESAALQDLGAAEVRLQALRRAGFKVAIDDFGAGAASFDYLRRLSVDCVKIDGAYIRDIAHDAKAQKMVGHLVALCRSLRLTTVAEMVETEEAATVLKELGVDLGQGWLYGRPSAAPEAPAQPPPVRRRGEVESWG